MKMPKHDSSPALFSTMTRRVSRRFSSLLNLFGIILVVSGIVGLLFLQNPLQRSTEDRSGATSDQGPATTTFEPSSGTTLVYSGSTQNPAQIDFKLNTQGFQTVALQYVFNVVTPILAEPPQIALNAGVPLKIDQSEVQQVGDGYLVAVSLSPVTDGDSFTSTQPTTVFSLSLKPASTGAIDINFDQEFSFAALDDGSAIVDGLKTLPVINYSFESNQPSPTPTAVPSPTPTLAPSPTPTIVPSPDPDLTPAPSPDATATPLPSPTPTAVPTPTPSPSPSPVGQVFAPVNWQTSSVSLQASGLSIMANGQPFYPTASTSVHSDPPSDPLDGYTTLETTWNQFGKEMRLFMYIYKDANKWTVEEMRIYDGNAPGNWIFFPNPVMATGPRAGQKMTASLGTAFTDSGRVSFQASTNGNTGVITFDNINLKAFLPMDDLSLSGSPSLQATFTNSSGQTVSPTQLIQGQTYKAQVQFTANNSYKFTASGNVPTLSAHVSAAGQTAAQKDITVSYGAIASSANGVSLSVNELSFVAGATNSVSAFIDSTNSFPETNENNNYYVLSWAAQGTGGVTLKQCNETCTSNDQCQANQRCYDTGSGVSRCRLVTNVSSEGCQPPAAGSVSCNNVCSYSSECNSGLSCIDGVCRNPLNAGSASCAAPSSTQTALINQSCNKACTSNSNCAVNLTCYYGVCRLAANPSSSSCSAASTSTVSNTYTSTSGSTTKGGVTTGATPSPTPSASPSGSLQPVLQSPPPDWSSTKSAVPTTPAPTETEQTWMDSIRTLLGETGKLAAIVIGVGVGLLLLSLLWILLAGRKKKGPPSGPVTVKENVVLGNNKPGSMNTPGPASLAPTGGKPSMMVAPAAPKAGGISSAVVPHLTTSPELKPAAQPMGVQQITPLEPAKPGTSAGSPMPPAASTLAGATPATPTAAPASGSSMLDRIKEKGITAPKQN